MISRCIITAWTWLSGKPSSRRRRSPPHMMDGDPNVITGIKEDRGTSPRISNMIPKQDRLSPTENGQWSGGWRNCRMILGELWLLVKSVHRCLSQPCRYLYAQVHLVPEPESHGFRFHKSNMSWSTNCSGWKLDGFCFHVNVMIQTRTKSSKFLEDSYL